MNRVNLFKAASALVAVSGILYGCTGSQDDVGGVTTGLQLPAGFSATVFADKVGPARHIAVNDNGDVYVALRRDKDTLDGGGLIALRDNNGDGMADEQLLFGPDDVDTGLAIYEGVLFFSTTTEVYAIPLSGALAPTEDPELVVGGFPAQRSHSAKPITFDMEGNLYINSGAPSNACQKEQRTRGSPGMNPCPQLERTGGIWRFVGNSRGQDQMGHGVRFSTGSRQVVALEYNPLVDQLYMVMHGRDSLDRLFPEHFTQDQRVELPAEEFHAINQGDNFGWPYTYWDPFRNERMVAPEYGGDGETASMPGKYKDPLIAFPAHYAPNDLIFYSGEQFPERYHGGAFIAFHGSWNRAPAAQAGYNVVFVPMKNGLPSGEWEVFADGFMGADSIESPRDAAHRPAGLAQGPYGELYITDDAGGRIWRVTYQGE